MSKFRFSKLEWNLPERCCLVVGLLLGIRLRLGPIPPCCCDCPYRDGPRVVVGDDAVAVFPTSEDDTEGSVSFLTPSGFLHLTLGLGVSLPEKSYVLFRYI